MAGCRLILYVVLWSVVVGSQHRQCPVGFYGSSCQHTCPMTCNNQQCNIDEVGRTFCIDGCVDGYRGASCRIPCPVNCQVCERLNGSCINCKAPFHGTNCTLTCEELCQGFRCETDQRCSKTTCLDGWYGKSCSNKCYPRYLTCARSTGNCTACKYGFHGSFCLLPCPQCGFTDNRTNQTCKDGCKRTPCSNIKHVDSGNGLLTYNCSNGGWGIDCGKSCSRHCLSYSLRTCNETTGSCTYGCEPGWHGDQCQHQCSASCLNSTCHQNNGTCASCEKGICGGKCSYMCDQVQNVTPGPSPVTLTGTLSLAVSGVLLVLVTGIVILQCRNHHSISQQGSTGQTGARCTEHDEAYQSNAVALRHELNTCDGHSYWQIDETRFDAGYSEREDTEVRKSGLSDDYADCISLNKPKDANIALFSSIVCDDDGMLYLDENASDVSVRYVTPQPSE